MNKSDLSRIKHIRQYCHDIAEFIERFGNDYSAFTSDRAYYSAVSMCILQIGELANGLSDEFRSKTKDDIPWGMVRGMRNWLAHAYSSADESMIWETATCDIPKLQKFCERIISKEKKRDEECL